jgi:signal transduction histidine kinase
MIDWKTRAARWRWEAALAICTMISLGILILSETGHQRLTAGYELGLRSMWANARLGELRALMLDAETSQRGYLLTGRENYLEPHDRAVEHIITLKAQVRDYYNAIGDRPAIDKYADIVAAIDDKLAEIAVTLRMVQEGRETAARELVDTDMGKMRMDLFNERINELQVIERNRTASLVTEWRTSLGFSRLGIAVISALNVVLLVILFRWLKREWQRGREREADLDEQVKQRTEQLARLSAHLQEVSEIEKSRLSRELHDELGAILTATRLDLLWIQGRLPPGESELRDKLKLALITLDQGITVKRRIIEDLRPSILTTFGLVTAASELARQFVERTGWKLKLDLPPDDPDLDEDIEIAMFRILQESLTNASKHSQARRVRISLQCNLGEGGKCTLEVEDDGIGFLVNDIRPSAHGLAGMRQRVEPRGGSLIIRSAHNKGTLLRATVPINVGPRSSDKVSTTTV